jgi:anti-sigma-K factor RskA
MLAVWQFIANSTTKGELLKVQSAQLTLESQVDQLKENLLATSENLSIANKQLNEAFDPAIKKVVLTSVKENEQVQLALFWNTVSGQIKIDPTTLPKLSADLQYQLWVLLDGNPVDMGVISKDATEVLVASGVTLAGQAFAITVEPLGGNASPTLEKLIVLGLVV